ncbi:adenosylmethionine decarboxylase [Candidatus Wolfebacteria bacterium]|nr:adenosylmethionine decarboxylase [Candidatus Wolfebacteria bacterium]
MEKNFGKHLIIDAHKIKEQKLKNLQAIKNLLEELPKRFDMNPLGKAVVKKISTDYYPDWGISGFIMLYESHISIHTWPEEKYMAMDIYSCKNFSDKEIIKYLKKYFGCEIMKTKTITRG